MSLEVPEFKGFFFGHQSFLNFDAKIDFLVRICFEISPYGSDLAQN